jgi:hypothetical protein
MITKLPGAVFDLFWRAIPDGKCAPKLKMDGTQSN